MSNYQVPQLWSSFILPNDGNGIPSGPSRRISSIAEIEADKIREASQKADEQKALAEAKLRGREAHAAVKARITQERAAAAEAKTVEKLRIAAEQKAEKARLAAENKARQSEKRVRLSFFMSPSNGYCLSGGETQSGVADCRWTP